MFTGLVLSLAVVYSELGKHEELFNTGGGFMVTIHSRTLLVYSGVFTFLVDAYPTYAASALAANSFARSTFGGIFPLFGIQSMSLCLCSFLEPTESQWLTKF